MKFLPAIPIVAALALTACDTMNSPITSGNFDPLGAPGGARKSGDASAPVFKAGQFVRASMNNTGFYRVRPKADANADKLLARGTSMKVITVSGSYAKVELDSGDIGFVPTIMLEDPNAAVTPLPAPVNPGEYQIYPPVPSGIGEPLPQIDPAGLPPAGSIPTVIDPNLPQVVAPVPGITPSTETFPTPAPPVEAEKVPLPDPAR